MTTVNSDQPRSDAAPDTGFRFRHPLRVRWAEADMQGVVFNGHYLTYFDVGMTEYLRAVCEGDLARMKSVFDSIYVVKSTIEYRAPAHFDEELEVSVRTARIGRTSLVFEFELSRSRTPLVTGENVYVHAPGGGSSPVPQSLRDAIARFEAWQRA